MKRSRPQKGNPPKVSRNSRRNADSDNENGDCPSYESKQRSRSTRRNEREVVREARPTRTRATARFIEEDAMVDMEAEGQDTDFGMEESQDLDSQDRDRISRSRSRSDSRNVETTSGDESEEDGEVTFNQSQQSSTNNNATRAEPDVQSDAENVPNDTSAVGSLSAGKAADDMCSVMDEGINKSMTEMHQYFDRKFDNMTKVMELERELAQKKQQLSNLEKKGKSNNINTVVEDEEVQRGEEDSQSEVTVYKRAVNREETNKRDSLSSDEPMDTSDELPQSNDLNTQEYFSERAVNQPEPSKDRRVTPRVDDRPAAERSYQELTPAERQALERKLVEEKAARLLKESEQSKARIYEVAGKETNSVAANLTNLGPQLHAVIVDESYRLVASHLDESLRKKIINQEFVEFAKLLPAKRGSETEQLMRLVNKGGQAFYSPIVDRSAQINCYAKWEQAFRIFSDVYTSVYPQRGPELIQYNHIIHSAAQSFLWDNVSAYDIEFRQHMSRNPFRNWGVILQQAYTMCIKDRHRSEGSSSNSGWRGGESPAAMMKKRKPCIAFQRGTCKFGSKCKWDHRCNFCNKFGHGTSVCRKAVGSTGNEMTENSNNEKTTNNSSHERREFSK